MRRCCEKRRAAGSRSMPIARSYTRSESAVAPARAGQVGARGPVRLIVGESRIVRVGASAASSACRSRRSANRSSNSASPCSCPNRLSLIRARGEREMRRFSRCPGDRLRDLQRDSCRHRRSVRQTASPRRVPGALCYSRTMPNRDGGLRRFTALGTPLPLSKNSQSPSARTIPSFPSTFARLINRGACIAVSGIFINFY